MIGLLAQTAAAALPDLDQPLKTGERSEAEAAVVVGIEDYFVLPDVPHATRDAQAVYDFLVYTRGLPTRNIQLLDGSPVREKILKAVEAAAATVGSEGTVWIYFAGHGAASPETGERVLLGADTQADLDVFDARALPVADLREAATAGGARAVLIVDACYTGRGRGGSELVPGKRFAVPTSATAAEPRVLEWSAAGPGEWSGPLEAARHGAFTYTVLGALRGWADGQLDDAPDGQITAYEADLYVQEALRSLQIGEQRPVMSVDGAEGWVLSRGTEPRPTLSAADARVPPPAPAPPPPVEAVVAAPAPDPVVEVWRLPPAELLAAKAEDIRRTVASGECTKKSRDPYYVCPNNTHVNLTWTNEVTAADYLSQMQGDGVRLVVHRVDWDVPLVILRSNGFSTVMTEWAKRQYMSCGGKTSALAEADCAAAIALMKKNAIRRIPQL